MLVFKTFSDSARKQHDVTNKNRLKHFSLTPLCLCDTFSIWSKINNAILSARNVLFWGNKILLSAFAWQPGRMESDSEDCKQPGVIFISPPEIQIRYNTNKTKLRVILVLVRARQSQTEILTSPHRPSRLRLRQILDHNHETFDVQILLTLRTYVYYILCMDALLCYL